MGSPVAATEQAQPNKLRLTFIQECCTGDGAADPPATVEFRLRNSNSEAVAYELRQAGGGVIQSGDLAPGDSFVSFPYGARTLILRTVPTGAEDTKAGGNTFLTAADSFDKCGPSKPDPIVQVTELVNCASSGEMQVTITTTTFDYVLDGTVWVDGEVTEVVTYRQRTDAEQAECFPTTTTTAPPPTTAPPTTAPCVAGTETVTDVATGIEYEYSPPVVAGVDACGDPIPDICVEWNPGYFTTLWTVQDCTPTEHETTEPPTTDRKSVV